MVEKHEDDYEHREKVRQGNICVKSIVLLGLAILLVVMATLVYGYIVGLIRGSSPSFPVIPPDQFSVILLTFAIGVVFGFILREATMSGADE